MDLIQLWWLSLAILALVVVVVAGLLALIIRTAGRIDERAAGIWQAGKEIAANTVSIWILSKASQELGQVREATQGLEEKIASLEQALRASAGGPGRSAE